MSRRFAKRFLEFAKPETLKIMVGNGMLESRAETELQSHVKESIYGQTKTFTQMAQTTDELMSETLSLIVQKRIRDHRRATINEMKRREDEIVRKAHEAEQARL